MFIIDSLFLVFVICWIHAFFYCTCGNTVIWRAHLGAGGACEEARWQHCEVSGWDRWTVLSAFLMFRVWEVVSYSLIIRLFQSFDYLRKIWDFDLTNSVKLLNNVPPVKLWVSWCVPGRKRLYWMDCLFAIVPRYKATKSSAVEHTWFLTPPVRYEVWILNIFHYFSPPLHSKFKYTSIFSIVWGHFVSQLECIAT